MVTRRLGSRNFSRITLTSTTEQLFKVFDQDHEGALTYNSFLIGLAAVCRGTHEQRADFLFGMFDLRK